MNRNVVVALLGISLLALSPCSSAEVLKKRYTFDLTGGGSRRAMQMRAEALARKRLLSDYIADKLSSELVKSFHEEIDINLTPSENYLRDFKVLQTDDSDANKIVVTVQGDIDLPAVLDSLTSAHVLKFGEPAPKILLMPSQNTSQFGITKSLRALIFRRIKQVGLRPVAFEGVSRVTSVQGKISEDQVRIIANTGLEYQADYVVYIDAVPDIKPASVGGYICDLNLTYTVLRPNNNVILGEAVASERGSGNAPQAALDRALDSLAPVIATKAIGQLYESIFADSDVITDISHLKNSVTVSVLFKDSSLQTQEIIKALQERGAVVTMATGGATDRFVVETTMPQTELYTLFNSLVLKGPEMFRTSVVEFGEGTISVEVVREGAASKEPLAGPPRDRNTAKASGFAVVKMRHP